MNVCASTADLSDASKTFDHTYPVRKLTLSDLNHLFGLLPADFGLQLIIFIDDRRMKPA